MSVVGDLGVFTGLTNSKVLLASIKASSEDKVVSHVSDSTVSMYFAINSGPEFIIIA